MRVDDENLDLRVSDISENSEALDGPILQTEAICAPDDLSSSLKNVISEDSDNAEDRVNESPLESPSLKDVISEDLDKAKDRVNESPLESPSYPDEAITKTQEISICKKDAVDNEINKSTDIIPLDVPDVPETSDKSDSNEESNKSTDDFPFVQDSFSLNQGKP